MTDFGEPVTVSEVRNRPKSGSFSIRAAPLDWVYCRERFDKFFGPAQERFFFSVVPYEAESVVEFMWQTEEILAVDKRTIFCKTNRNYCLAVNPSVFWRECAMRRSLFTILLRCGGRYVPDKNNYEGALFSQRYMKETENAVKRFLFGFTRLWKTNQASYTWVANFRNVDADTCRQKLLSPDIQDEGLLGASSLWR